MCIRDSVNGTLRTDVIVHYENPLHIYIPLGSGKEGSFIKSVAIDQTPFSLQRGINANLTATVAGNAEDKSVTDVYKRQGMRSLVEDLGKLEG